MIFRRNNLVDKKDVLDGIRELGLSGRPVCIHASLRSFGRVKHGSMTIIDAFLEAGCTVVVPTFSWCFLAPPRKQGYQQNGAYYMGVNVPHSFLKYGYHPSLNDIDLKNMGAFPMYVLQQPERVRSSHPLCSFAALGPHAKKILSGQEYLDIYAPFDVMEEMNGAVVLMGVDYDKCTLLHNAEKRAGIRLMRRWAFVGGDRQVVETENGSCSSGFVKFSPLLQDLVQECYVGQSRWRTLSVKEGMRAATQAIQGDLSIRHCGYSYCVNCNDLALGGPIL